MQNSPDFGNYLHQHPDLLLAPQLQNLSYHFFNLVQHHPFSIIKEGYSVILTTNFFKRYDGAK
jgi:hypothetical protein